MFARSASSTAAPGRPSGCWSSACAWCARGVRSIRGRRRMIRTLRRRAVPRQGDLADAAHDAGAEGRSALRHRGGRSRRQHGERHRQGRQPAAVRRRHARPGDREVPARRRHLLHDISRTTAPATTTSATPLRSPRFQRPADRRRWRSRPTSRCRSRSTRRAARSWPGSARRRPRCPATWPWRGALRGRRPSLGQGHRQGARGRRRDAGLRAGLRRQHQPQQPGHRDPFHRGRSWSGLQPRRQRR